MKRICSCAFAFAFCLSAFSDQTISLVITNDGRTFDGIGGVSGGGATSVLLKDYIEPQRSQILDYLFKPKFGAAMSALFVEIPGDGNSTQGSELSHAHFRGDENYFRGYEWWLMREAKKRNPAITLDGVAWGCPNWVGNNNFWSQDMCDYYVQWIQGLQREHGLSFDAIGCRNEKGVNEDFAKKLRATLDRAGLEKVRVHGFDNWGNTKWDWTKNLTNDAELRRAVDIIGNHTMSEVGTPDSVKKLSDEMGKPIWNTEEHVYKKGFDCEISLVQVFNRNYISNGVTKIVCWYLESSTYPIEPFFDVTTLVASTPWSGQYKINPALWAYAHYGQFVKVGWKYVDGACGYLNDGGSFVTMTSGKDFSTILETKGSAVNQVVTFQVSGGLAAEKICVWRSNAKEQFVKLADLAPVNGAFSLTLEPNSIYSLSTTTGQQKGSFGEPLPAKSFPFPFFENFDHYAEAKSFGYLPHYTADISGGFEIADRPDGNGKCLRQVIAEKAQSWAPEWMPYTIIGDEHWTDYEVSADVNLEHGGWVGLLGRVSNTGGGYGCNPKGYYVRLDAEGTCSIWLSTQTKNGAPGKQLATASMGEIGTNTWHNLKLQCYGTNLNAFVDGKQILSVGDSTYPSGLAGLVTGGEGNARNTAIFDNLIINSVNGAKPEPTIFPQDAAPMYADSQLPSSQTPQAIVAAHADDFNSGSPEAKNIWDGLAAAVNDNDIATTQTVLEQLKNAEGLTPNQLKAIAELEGAFKTVAPLPLKVVGTNILNSKDEPVWLRGVNAASMEWTSDGQGCILETVNIAIRNWHVNIIRLPLTQDRWFGKGPEQTDGGKSYRDLIHQIVDVCATNRCYIILDLHWSDCNEWGRNIGQHSMPDSNSVAFWKDIAPTYANHPAVIFDLYNEPHDVSWDVWLHGGTITDKPINRQQVRDSKTYQAVGMQVLLDTVRATGARNVVIAGGLDWAYDFSGILKGRQLSDPHGNGVIYANHCYDNKNESVDAWITRMETAAAKLPVIVSEFGGVAGPGKVDPTDNWLLHVLKALDEHRWPWTAWDFHPGAGPSLISGRDYTPTEKFGVHVKRVLAEAAPTH